MKILLIQLKRIGDLILTTPVVRALREAFPDAEISLITDASSAQISEGVPVDHRLVFHRDASLLAGLFGSGKNSWVKTHLRRTRYDFCFDFTGTDRSALLTALTKSPRKVTYERFRRKFLRSRLYTDFVDASVRDLHTADFHTSLLCPLTPAGNIALDLALPPQTSASAARILATAGVTAPFAVIHAGTARAEKYWVPERWSSLADALRQRGLQVILTGSRDPAEQQHLTALKAAAHEKLIDLSGQTDLLELAAIIAQARLFCGVDTAAMHLADAMLTPCLALFGPTNPYHWRPRHTRSIILRPRTTQPFAPSQKGGPMVEIETSDVLAAIDTLLTEGSRADSPR